MKSVSLLDCNATAQDVYDVLEYQFPKLKEGGGFELLCVKVVLERFLYQLVATLLTILRPLSTVLSYISVPCRRTLVWNSAPLVLRYVTLVLRPSLTSHTIITCSLVN